MKKSVYIADRTSHWSNRLNLKPDEVEPQVRQDVEAVEATGMEWDKETPYRIELSAQGQILTYETAESEPHAIGFIYEHQDVFYGQELVFRYNHFLPSDMYMEQVNPVWCSSLEKALDYLSRIHRYYSPDEEGGIPLYELLEWLKKANKV